MHEGYNILFGVLACRMQFVDPERLRQANHALQEHSHRLLSDFMVERGWLTGEQRQQVQELLDSELRASAAAMVEGMVGEQNGPARLLLDELRTDVARGEKRPEPPSSETLAMDLGSPAPRGALPGSETSLVAKAGDSPAPARYRLTEVYAEGGLGRIWIAHDQHLKRDVALKQLRPEVACDENSRQRFLREAMLTGQLEHPDIVPVYELSVEEPLYYTMRFVRGKTLQQAIAEYHKLRHTGERAALDRSLLLDAFVRICQAIGFAHARGVLHRDLKPSNILLGDYGEVIVLDWGLAMLSEPTGGSSGDLAARKEEFGQSSVTTGTVVGTPGYMSPEQAAGLCDRFQDRCLWSRSDPL